MTSYSCTSEESLVKLEGKGEVVVVSKASISNNQIPLQEDRAEVASSLSDSLYANLIEVKDQFFKWLKKGEYVKAHDYLHPEGLYFYTLGKISPQDFTLKTLRKRKGELRGIYLNGGYGPAGNIVDTICCVEEADKMQPKYVSGTYWLDSMLTNFTWSQPIFHDFYYDEAYGTSGNYSSDHAKFFSDTILFENKPIVVMEIASNTSGYREELMVEFFQDDSGTWKIYAIGNKEWTP